jgi:hypothetical protein
MSDGSMFNFCFFFFISYSGTINKAHDMSFLEGRQVCLVPFLRFSAPSLDEFLDAPTAHCILTFYNIDVS